ncbi:unnamed protein product [Larinioides sclopetarius]|uniref:Uncharacterized protein n=1 Tax=Larinioides sclopetarius TaxID=280406 RepID=A0AAV2AH66_9ARAC
MKLFWIMIFCAAVFALLSTPSEAKPLARMVSKMRHFALPGSEMMVKRIKRSPQRDNRDDWIYFDTTTTVAPTTTTESSGSGGIIGGIETFFGGIYDFFANIFSSIF